MSNMHYLYNVDYFKPLETLRVFDNKNQDNSSSHELINSIKDTVFKDSNELILNYKYNSKNEYLNSIKKSIGDSRLSSFVLYTSYPGLLIGTGYCHDVKSKTAIVGGFYFDQVTGLPIVPGSTVKGMLRSYFPEEGKKNSAEREELIKTLLEDDTLNVNKLVDDIFDNNDIFIGAYPVIEEDGNIMALDYITPHLDPLKNPNVNTILKVKPNVKYEFLFVLKDNIIDRSKKLELFRNLILLGGIGGKTNVGFGQFSENMTKAPQIDNDKDKKNSMKSNNKKTPNNVRNE